MNSIELITPEPQHVPELGRICFEAFRSIHDRHNFPRDFPDVETAVMYAVLLERACRTQLLAEAAGGPMTWSGEAETVFKRNQVWNRDQLHTGWDYLVRRASST